MFTEDFQIGDAKISLETGALARQALGAVVARHRKTVMLATVVARPITTHPGFLPLTVDYRERAAAAGRIPGGFGRREGRPSEREILTSRLIDRALRPRFQLGLLAEIQLQVTVLSADLRTDLEGLALTAASAAVSLSGLPVDGPVVGLRLSSGAGGLHTFISARDAEQHDHDVVAAFGREGLQMLEGGGAPISELELMLLLDMGAAEAAPALDALERLASAAGRVGEWAHVPAPVQAQLAVWNTSFGAELQTILEHEDGPIRGADLAALKARSMANHADLDELGWNHLLKATLRAMARAGRRFGERALDAIRPFSATVDTLPGVHGDGLFTRGHTQVLASATIGSQREGLMADGLQGHGHNHFFLHYNFPGFAVGDPRNNRAAPNRREMGHGALAARALKAQLPPIERFPHAVRVVADVLESDGSSSMATVCAGSLALMDAGVPISQPVAGISIGLVRTPGSDHGDYTLLTDITADEDGAGEMDLKIAGTADGITALQLDLKLSGLPMDVLREALGVGQSVRAQLLTEMSKALASPREQTRGSAPAFAHVKVSPEALEALSTQGQKRIQGIQSRTQARIELHEGRSEVWIFGKHRQSLNDTLKALRQPPKASLSVGETYLAKVTSMRPFGAIVRIDDFEGLVHVSELAEPRPADPTDVVNVGDAFLVKVIGLDDKGRPRLSRRAAL